MKISVFTLLAVALFSCVPAAAQDMPDATPNPALRQAFEQARTRMQSVHRAERSEMLNALTPQHRALLASIAGQLATAVDPDFDAAAKRLDSALSSTESQAVLRAAENARRQQRSLMESMIPPPPPGAGPPETRREYRLQRPGGNDAGHVLLGTMIGRPGMGFGAIAVMHDGMELGP